MPSVAPSHRLLTIETPGDWYARYRSNGRLLPDKNGSVLLPDSRHQHHIGGRGAVRDDEPPVAGPREAEDGLAVHIQQECRRATVERLRPERLRTFPGL